jgi:glyoxylase-like metal-dependent hydrolase (beta-lactamase superfamily II)
MIDALILGCRQRPQLSRRAFVAGGIGSCAALSFTHLAAPAYAIGRLALGDAELVVVTDGTLTLPMSFAFPDAPAEELAALLSEYGLATDSLVPDCNVTLLKQGDRLTIFDAGAGSNFMPTAGKLLDSLAEAGIDPADVTDVVFTHAHPDHLWGVTDDFDELVFPNASFRIGRAEWDYWSSPETLSSVPEERQSFVVGAQNRFAAIEDRIAFIEPGDEVMPGVEAIDTAGHTPGHISFLVHAGSEPVLIVGDALTNVAISFAHPEWPSGSDQDPEMAIKTRRALLDRLAADRPRIVGFHLPHPGLGTVERHGGAYRFVPQA